MNNEKCPMCESAHLIPKKTVEHYCYKEHDFSLKNIEYAVCPRCNSEVVTPVQIKRNEARICDEHRKIDGLLTSTELRQLRKHFNITQSQAAQIFGVEVQLKKNLNLDNAFSGYENGEITQSLATDKLMKLALDQPPCFEKLCKMANIGFKHPTSIQRV